MLFQEREGFTVITTLQAAQEHGLHHLFSCRMITCEVHSSLEAVGFMAVISGLLAMKGIATNPVSGFFHDHLFVPVGREEEAMDALKTLRSTAAAGGNPMALLGYTW